MVFSKKSIFLFFLFSLTFSILFAQNVPASSAGNVNESEISLNITDDGTAGNNVFGSGNESRKSSVWPFVRMILMLVLVIAAVYGVLFFMKRRGAGGRSDDQFLRRVAYLNLGQGKSVEVVTLVDKGAYLLGVTEGGINLISEVKDEELIQAMNLYADKQANTTRPKNFSDVLDIFMPGGPRESASQNQNVFSSGEQGMNEMFQNGNDRLNERE